MFAITRCGMKRLTKGHIMLSEEWNSVNSNNQGVPLHGKKQVLNLL